MEKTTNYQLNQWESTDKLSRADFNNDNAAIDAAIQAVADTASSKASAESVSALSESLTAQIAAKGNCRIAIGSYTGNGKYGSGNPNKLSFDFKPLMIVGGGSGFILLSGAESSAIANETVSWSGNSVSWYNQYSEEYQFNVSGRVYHYVAVGV